MSLYHFQFLNSFCVCYNFVYVLSIRIFMNWIPVHILQLLTTPLLFFTGSRDNTVRIWDVATKQQVAELKGHTSYVYSVANYVYSVAFDSSGKYLASGEIA